jgi:hypothetical protein
MATLPTLDPLWRPTATSTRNDRDLIRTYIGWPATDGSLTELTQQMNTVAALAPSTVAQVQAWVDEIVTLETTQADEIDAGTAHLGNAEEYDGPIPGTSPTRDQQLSQAGKLSWDTSLLKARYRFGGGARATAQGQRDERIELLTNRIANALNCRRMAPQGAAGGGGMLLRS